MRDKNKVEEEYAGFEQGAIRPPSEASSLLLRLTRNCPWNRCSFCPVYKRHKFSLRPLEHILLDIDAVQRHVATIRELADQAGGLTYAGLEARARRLESPDQAAFYAAANWVSAGMQSIFLQDGNSLVLPPERLVTILEHIRHCFPSVERITSYARSHTIDRISDADMARLARAGLNRIHIGMESGSNRVLALVNKGSDKAAHIRAGQKVKRAGIQLSEYVMPGLGGRALSQEHALETADALNQIDADFIRLRTLAIPKRGDLFEQWSAGSFEKLSDPEVAAETLLFIESLHGITSTIKSDHILNLFGEVEGRLPDAKPQMLEVFRRFLALPAAEQVLYQVGRRNGLFSRLTDLADPARRGKARSIVQQLEVTPENVDQYVVELMKRFV
jgi:hypothetical protein